MGITPQRYGELMRGTSRLAEQTTEGIVVGTTTYEDRSPYLMSVVLRGGPELHYVLVANVTNVGFVSFNKPEPLSPSALILDVHTRSGLTWDELSRLFGCDKRTLHLWARGSRPSDENESRLRQVANLVRQRDVGSPDATRRLLFSSAQGSESLFSMLSRTARAELHPTTAKTTPGVSTRQRPSLPSELLGALHDNVTNERGRLVAAKPLRRRHP
jgi:hypothetical protein